MGTDKIIMLYYYFFFTHYIAGLAGLAGLAGHHFFRQTKLR